MLTSSERTIGTTSRRNGRRLFTTVTSISSRNSQCRSSSLRLRGHLRTNGQYNTTLIKGGDANSDQEVCSSIFRVFGMGDYSRIDKVYFNEANTQPFISGYNVKLMATPIPNSSSSQSRWRPTLFLNSAHGCSRSTSTRSFRSEPLFLFFTKVDDLIDRIVETYDRPLINGFFDDLRGIAPSLHRRSTRGQSHSESIKKRQLPFLSARSL